MPLQIQETTTYLEMTEPTQLSPANLPAVEVSVRQVELPCPEINRFFYTAIGGDWYWTDRLGWTYQQWMQAITRPGHETWVAYVRGTPAGYFELEGPPGGEIEIVFFGVLPQFAGQGIGGHLLTLAVRRAWAKEARRVWLHASSLAHPHALSNYTARGFRIFKKEESIKLADGQPPGAWPGANRPRSIPCTPAQEPWPALDLATALAVIDTIPHRLVFVDNQHIIRHLNRAAEQHYCVERGLTNLLGQSIFDCHREPDSHAQIVAIHGRLLASENEIPLKINRFGEKVTVVAVRARDGSLLGYYERFEKVPSTGDSARKDALPVETTP